MIRKAARGIRAEELAHDGAVFLLDPSLVVLAIRARADALDAAAQAVFDQFLVHKLAIVVDVKRTKGEGQADPNALERLNNESTFTQRKRLPSNR